MHRNKALSKGCEGKGVLPVMSMDDIIHLLRVCIYFGNTWISCKSISIGMEVYLGIIYKMENIETKPYRFLELHLDILSFLS